MKKVLLFSILLVFGLIGSQSLPAYIGPVYAKVGDLVRILTGGSAVQAGAITEQAEITLHGAGAPAAEAAAAEIGTAQHVGRITAAQSSMGWAQIVLHVLIITIISNIGKMFPAFCYRKEVHWRERLAVAIGMWPRGEVGAGVLVISLSYGIGGAYRHGCHAQPCPKPTADWSFYLHR